MLYQFISIEYKCAGFSPPYLEGDLFQIHVYDLYREEEIQKQMEMLSAELFSKIGVDNLIIQFWTGAQMIE